MSDGLVTVLDLAGRRITELEDRVDDLERDLAEVRADRLRLADVLATLRTAVRIGDTGSLAPSEADRPDTRPHDPPPRSSS